MSTIAETPTLTPELGGMGTGLDFNQAPQGIYLWSRDATTGQVGRGGGGTYRAGHARVWNTGETFADGEQLSTAEAIERIGANFNVVQHRVYADLAHDLKGHPLDEDGAAKYRQATRFLANVREDTGKVLGVVGHKWRGPQYLSCFNFFDNLLDDGVARWLGGSLFGDGQRLVMIARLGEDLFPGGSTDERTLPLGFFTNGWDGSTGVRVTVGLFRLACSNGMTVPVPGHVRSWSMRHTRGLDGRIIEARRTLKLAVGYFEPAVDELNKLLDKPMNGYSMNRFVERLVPLPEVEPGKGGERKRTNAQELRSAILSAWTTDNLANVKTTAYGAYNAVVDHADWGARRRNDQLRLEKAIQQNTLKDRAYAMLAAS